MELSNNTILITGGAMGIGLALTEEFVKLGNNVIICGRRKDKLREAKQKFPAIQAEACDLSIESERIRLIEWLIRKHSSLNILVNNAGIQNQLDLSNSGNIDSIKNEIETNMVAPIHLNSLLIAHLKGKESSAIINITSGLAFTPLAIMPVYCATKAALHSYSLSLRHQLRKTSIKVFEIAPPTVDTDLDRGARAKREQTDRGIQPKDFALQAIAAIREDVYEAAIGQAAGLRLKREELFPMLNRH